MQGPGLVITEFPGSGILQVGFVEKKILVGDQSSVGFFLSLSVYLSPDSLTICLSLHTSFCISKCLFLFLSLSWFLSHTRVDTCTWTLAQSLCRSFF